MTAESAFVKSNFSLLGSLEDFMCGRTASLSVEPLPLWLDDDGREGLLLLVAAAAFSEISVMVMMRLLKNQTLAVVKKSRCTGSYWRGEETPLDEKETPVGVELIWLSSRLANHAY